MVVLSMSGSLIEMLHTVRRLVYGGWCMKKEMVCSAYCAECTTVKPIQPQKKFNQVTAVRFKKSVLLGKDRRSSQQHEMTIQREHHKWVSYFHNEFETQQQTKDSVLHNAFLSVYWLAREEIANRKFKSVTAKYFVALYFLSSLKRFLVLVL